MNKNSRIYIAGHRGLVGSALFRALREKGYTHRKPRTSNLEPRTSTPKGEIITRTRAELDLFDQAAVRDFFQQERPEYVFLAAAKVGGIHANNTYPAEFIHQTRSLDESKCNPGNSCGRTMGTPRITLPLHPGYCLNPHRKPRTSNLEPRTPTPKGVTHREPRSPRRKKVKVI